MLLQGEMKSLGSLTERGCSDLKQEFEKEGREEGMAFGRKSVDLVKAWTLVEGNRGEVAITFGGFSSVEGSL